MLQYHVSLGNLQTHVYSDYDFCRNVHGHATRENYPHLFKRNLEIIVEGDRFDCYIDADNITTDNDGNKVFTPNATNPLF